MKRMSARRVTAVTRAVLFSTVVLVLTLAFGTLSALAADTQEPAFQGITVSPSSGSPGDTLIVSVSATDNVGVEGGLVEYASPTGGSWSVDLTYDSDTGKLVGDFPIGDYDAPGLWEVVYLEIWDAEMNSVFLTSDEADLSGGNVTVSNPNPDTTPPTFISLNLSTTQTNPGGKVHVSIRATDSESGLSYAFVAWSKGLDAIPVILDYNEATGLLEGDLYIPLDQPTGTYELDLLSVLDQQSNEYMWTRDGDSPMMGKDLVLSSSPSAHVAGFKDVHPGDWFAESVFTLVALDVLGGYADGTFRPGNNVTRAEFAKMICQASGWELMHPARPSFSDVPSNHWAYDYIETAKANGVIGGYADGTFRPAANITRAEICKMLVSATSLSLQTSGASFTDVPDGHWARAYIITAKNNNFVSGYKDGSFKPGALATRAEAAKMINSSFEYLGI